MKGKKSMAKSRFNLLLFTMALFKNISTIKYHNFCRFSQIGKALDNLSDHPLMWAKSFYKLSASLGVGNVFGHPNIKSYLRQISQFYAGICVIK
jgi:hypothetical protein